MPDLAVAMRARLALASGHFVFEVVVGNVLGDLSQDLGEVLMRHCGRQG